MTYIQELNDYINEIDLYTESAINNIIALENESAIFSNIFTENSNETTNKNIFNRIVETIENIFKKLISLFRKGKVKVKADAQTKAITEIGKNIKNRPDVQITIPDVWKFSQFADKTIDDYVKKFDIKKAAALNKDIKGSSTINLLTRNLNEISAAMRSGKNKKIAVTGKFNVKARFNK